MKDEAFEILKEWFSKSGDPFFASEAGGDVYCFFCREWQLDSNNPVHADDCLYVRAKQLVERPFGQKLDTLDCI